MYYSSVAFLALVIFMIINYDIMLKKQEDFKDIVPAVKEYRWFLYSVLLFFSADLLWGILEGLKLITLLYIDTMVFFTEMAFAVFLWTRFVIAYLNDKSFFAKILKYTGLFFLLAQWIVVILNLFTPVLFSFDENDNYVAQNLRYISMLFQIIMYLMSSAYLVYVAVMSEGRKKFRRRAVAVFGLVMTAFIILQALYPMLPFYSAGYLAGTCLLHTFFVEDLKYEQVTMLKQLLENEKKQKEEITATRHVAYTDALTHVRNKHAYVEKEAELDRMIAEKELKNFGLIVFDVNGLKYVNDTYGHDMGDKYLQDACKMICVQFQHSPVFRIGGDEFVALISGTDYDNRVQLLSDFDKRVEENIEKKSVVVSTGYDEYNPETDNSFNTIFTRADKKMYERKRKLKEMGSI